MISQSFYRSIVRMSTTSISPTQEVHWCMACFEMGFKEFVGLLNDCVVLRVTFHRAFHELIACQDFFSESVHGFS